MLHLREASHQMSLNVYNNNSNNNNNNNNSINNKKQKFHCQLDYLIFPEKNGEKMGSVPSVCFVSFRFKEFNLNLKYIKSNYLTQNIVDMKCKDKE